MSNKIVDIEYVYKKNKKYNNTMYIYIGFLVFLLIICLLIIYKNNN
jgi:hypothetical protein